MTECDQTEVTKNLQKPVPDVRLLRDFADGLRASSSMSDWCARNRVPLKNKERKLRKEMEEAAAGLARAEQKNKLALKNWQSAQDELASMAMCLWMVQMKRDLGDVINRFADSIGDVRKMAAACQDFINFFGDSARWHTLYATCEDNSKFGSLAHKNFDRFEIAMEHAWACLSFFVITDKVDAARIAFKSLLSCWSSEQFWRGNEKDVSSLSYMKQWRNKFSRTLISMNEELNHPETFFVRVEKEKARTETKARSVQGEVVKTAKPKRKVLLDVNRDISRYGYVVEGDRKTIHFGKSSSHLTAPIVVKKVNEMIKALFENGTDAYVPFPVEVSNQFHREPYASFLHECIRRKIKPDSDPESPLFLPEARLRVRGEA